jgi:hypothetical protein
MEALMTKNRVVRADMLWGLPEPVQRYMTYSGVVGQPWIDTVRIKQMGKFRMAANKPWMPMTAIQYYTTEPPGYLWKAQFKVAGLSLMRARDTYKYGRGHMFGKLAGLINIFDERGEKLDQGTMVRYLSEMIWFPVAFLGENIAWQGIDDHSAQVTLTDCGKRVSGRMLFDDVGRPLNFIAQRYNLAEDGLYTWSAPNTDFGVRAGLHLPIRAQAMWNLPSGDLPYIDVQVTEVAYNEPIESF